MKIIYTPNEVQLRSSVRYVDPRRYRRPLFPAPVKVVFAICLIVLAVGVVWAVKG